MPGLELETDEPSEETELLAMLDEFAIDDDEFMDELDELLELTKLELETDDDVVEEVEEDELFTDEFALELFCIVEDELNEFFDDELKIDDALETILAPLELVGLEMLDDMKLTELTADEDTTSITEDCEDFNEDECADEALDTSELVELLKVIAEDD